METSSQRDRSGRAARARERLAVAFVVGGALALAAAEVLLHLEVEPVPTWFYCFAWWPAIVLVDGVVRLRTGSSLILDRTRAFLACLPWSVAFWMVFELVNFRLQNWYYVALPAGALERRIGIAVSFATVLPGVIEAADLFASFGLAGRARTPGFAVTPRLRRGLVAAGVLSVGLALALPEVCFPLVWGSVALLLEPWLVARGERSLLGELAAGRPALLLRWLAGGAACGLLWELWNFWSRAKWIYTVPFFEEGKLFEMPYLGFLGFPAFALECFVLLRALVALRLLPEWEARAAPAATHRSALAAGAGALAALAFAVATIPLLDGRTVRSTWPLDRGLSAPAAELGALAGMGVRGVRWLEHAGVEDLDALARADEAAVLAAFARTEVEAGRAPAPRPSPRELRVWLRRARRVAQSAASVPPRP